MGRGCRKTLMQERPHLGRFGSQPLVKNQISTKARKQILKASLRGIAELHSHDIVHLGGWSLSGLTT
ncbi:hypothetical protein TMatcc_007317 [Talaromyces marneffei ATCC 18224]